MPILSWRNSSLSHTHTATNLVQTANKNIKIHTTVSACKLCLISIYFSPDLEKMTFFSDNLTFFCICSNEEKNLGHTIRIGNYCVNKNNYTVHRLVLQFVQILGRSVIAEMLLDIKPIKFKQCFRLNRSAAQSTLQFLCFKL